MTTQDFTARTQSFGDWGSRCLASLGTPDWLSHLRECSRCRAVQARWDAEQAATASVGSA